MIYKSNWVTEAFELRKKTHSPFLYRHLQLHTKTNQVHEKDAHRLLTAGRPNGKPGRNTAENLHHIQIPVAV